VLTGLYSALSMYMDKPEFWHVPEHGHGHIRPYPCTRTSSYSGLSLYMDMAEYGPVHVQGKTRIWVCPCTWTRPNMAMSMFRDKPKFGPIPVHGQGNSGMSLYMDKAKYIHAHVQGHATIRACPCTWTWPNMLSIACLMYLSAHCLDNKFKLYDKCVVDIEYITRRVLLVL